MNTKHTCTLAIATIALLSAPSSVHAEDVEAWVSRPYYEGLPLERARDVGAQGIAKLAALLDDPGESAHHGNVVLALGASGHPDAFAVLAAHAAQDAAGPNGEVDRDTFRARVQLPIAMGHLAREDRRALTWLLREARGAPSTPDWSFRHQSGDHLADLLAEAHMTGLALSGAPRARRILERSAAESSAAGGRTNERRRRHAVHALEIHTRIAEGGPPALPRLGDPGPGDVGLRGAR